MIPQGYWEVLDNGETWVEIPDLVRARIASHPLKMVGSVIIDGHLYDRIVPKSEYERIRKSLSSSS